MYWCKDRKVKGIVCTDQEAVKGSPMNGTTTYLAKVHPPVLCRTEGFSFFPAVIKTGVDSADPFGQNAHSFKAIKELPPCARS